MTQDINPFSEVTRMLEQIKLPGVDMSAVVEARRKDIEALVEANRTAYEGMQTLARKQTEMLTQALQGIQQAAQGMAGGAMPDPAKQTELARDAFQKVLADMKDLADIARKSQTDAAASITQRATQYMHEMMQMMRPR